MSWTVIAAIALAAESWPAIFGGLIPVVGLAGVGYIIVHAVRDRGDDE